MKIRPNAKPIPPFGSGKSDPAKKTGEKTTKTPVDQAADLAKTAADVTKSKTSRLGKLIGGAAAGAADAAGKAAPAAGTVAGAVAGVGAAASGAAAAGVGGAASAVAAGARAGAAAGGRSMAMLQTIGSRAGGAMREGLAGVMPRIDRFQNIMQRHTELGYLVRLGGKNDDENDEEIRKAALGLMELKAGAGGASPGLAELMDRVKDLDQNSPAGEFAKQLEGAEELIEQAGQELEELDTQLAHELQTAASKLTEAQTLHGEVNRKFSDAVDRVIGNI